MKVRDEDVKRGVGEAFAEWLADHPVSLPATIEAAAKDAITEWLNSHEEYLISAIAEKLVGFVKAAQLPTEGPEQ